MKRTVRNCHGHVMPFLAAVLILAFSAAGFKTPVASGNTTSNHLKWKNTTWVNPFAATKTLAATVGYGFSTSSWFTTYYLRIKVNGTTVVNTTQGIWGEVEAPAGSTVTFEASVDPYWMMTILIDDNTSHQEVYYSDNVTTMSHSWTAIDGHSYYISFNGH